MDLDYAIYIDGGVSANHDAIAIAVVVCTPQGELYLESSRIDGAGTSNVAEYKALRYGIQLANLVGARRPMFCSDSNLVVQQVNRVWAMKAGGELAELHHHCTGALMRFDRWLLRHVPRDQNKRADWLCSKSLGHGRTLKNAPAVHVVDCDGEGKPGWAGIPSGAGSSRPRATPTW